MLLFGDLADVVSELFVGIARIAGTSLGFHDSEHIATCVIQAIVGDAVPGLRIIAINRNLQPDLGPVSEVPVGRPQLRVDVLGARLGFVESHGLVPAESEPVVSSRVIRMLSIRTGSLVRSNGGDWKSRIGFRLPPFLPAVGTLASEDLNSGTIRKVTSMDRPGQNRSHDHLFAA